MFQKLSIFKVRLVYIYIQIVDLETSKSINSSVFKGIIDSTDSKNSNQFSDQFFF